MSRVIVDDSYQGGVAVTPSDTVNITFPNGTLYSKAIYVGGTGNIVVKMADGSQVTLQTIPVGLYRLGVVRVLATGTTATNIVALY